MKSEKIPPPPPPAAKAAITNPESKMKTAAKAVIATQVMAAGKPKDDDGPKVPNLKEIAKQNQALDAQKAILVEINKQLASGKPLEDDEMEHIKNGTQKAKKKVNPPGAFSWDAKEEKSIRLRENATAWNWYSVEGFEPGKRRK